MTSTSPSAGTGFGTSLTFTTSGGPYLSQTAAFIEEVRIAEGDAGFVAGWIPGDWAALHWDWACDRLDERRLGFLRAATRRQLDLVNHDLRPGPAAILS